MFRRLLTVTAASALGVTMLTAAPAQAAAVDWVGPVTIESLTPTHVELAYACTGTVTFVEAIVHGDAAGYAETQALSGPSCTGETQTHRLPLSSYSWGGGNAASTQLPVGGTAAAMVSVEAGAASYGSAGLTATVEAGDTRPVKDLRLATQTPVAVWAGNGKPYADVWFRCDKGLQVKAAVGYVSFASGSSWSMPETAATCTGAWQKSRAALVRTGGSTKAPRKGEAVQAEYPSVATPHLTAILEGRSVKAF